MSYVTDDTCITCGGRIRQLGGWPWQHVGAGDDHHPAQPQEG